MGETLTGTDGMSLETMALIAGAVVICLALLIWIIKRRGHMIFMRGGGNRQPRLAVLDAAAVDSRRRLVLVRRDHVEHLILIGGPSDIVVESGIGRSSAAQAEKAKLAAKAAAKAAAKSNQEKRSADEPAPAQPVKAAAPAAAEAPKPVSKQHADKKPTDSTATASKTKSDTGDTGLTKTPEPTRPEHSDPHNTESAASKPVASEPAAATASLVASAAVNGHVTASEGKSAPAQDATTPSASGPVKNEIPASEPGTSQSVKNEFEDALEAARDLVMPENSGSTAPIPASQTSANYAHAVPAPPEPIDPIPAPQMPSEPAAPAPGPVDYAAPGPSTASPVGTIASAADDLVADFDRVLEAEMSGSETKKVVEFEKPQNPQPSNPGQTPEKPDVASLEDEMKKLLGDLSVKQ